MQQPKEERNNRSGEERGNMRTRFMMHQELIIPEIISLTSLIPTYTKTRAKQ